MKKILIICSLTVFLSGCILVTSEKKELSKEPHPTQSVVATKPAGPVRPPLVREPVKSPLNIDISCKDENNNINNYRWAEIYLDDNFISSTSRIQLFLDPGQYKIAVKAQGYKTYEKIITILPGQPVHDLNILLEKE